MQWVKFALLGGLYAVFWRWYSGGQAPLSADEIEHYLAQAAGQGDGDPAVVARVRAFLEADDGRSFVMVNLLKVHDAKPAAPADQQPAAQLDRYSAAFLGRLLRRAGHPILVGKAAAEALELWGLPPEAARWTNIGLVRYRSRRDMIASASTPLFAEIHPLKIAALETTIAVPAAPWLHLGDPRLLLGLVLLIALAWGGRRKP